METKTTELIDKVEVLRCIKGIFEQEFETLKRRSQAHQLLIGDNLTIIEMSLKACIKELPILAK